MSFKPITEQKFNELVSQGFTPDQIISFEQQRKAEETQPKKGGFGSMLKGFGKGVVKSGVSAVSGMSKLGDAVLGGVYGDFHANAPSTQRNIETRAKMDEFATPQSRSESFGKFTGDVAQFAIPAGKIAKLGKAAGIGKVALTGAKAISSGTVGMVQKGTPKGAAIPVAVEITLPVVGKLLGPLSSKVSAKASKALERMNLRMTPTQKQQLLKTQPDILEYMAKNKITGTPQVRHEKMGVILDQFEPKIEALLKGKKYSKTQAINAVKDLPDEFLDKASNPQVYSNMVKEVDELIKLIKRQKGKDITAAKINQFKRSYAKNARNKMGDVVQNDAREAISDGLYTILQRDFTPLKTINVEYSKALTAYKLIGKSIGRNELGLIGNLISMAAGGTVGQSVGGVLGGAAGTAVGPQVGKVIAGTQSRSLAGAALQRFAEFAANAPTNAAGDLIIPKAMIQGLLNQ